MCDQVRCACAQLLQSQLAGLGHGLTAQPLVQSRCAKPEKGSQGTISSGCIVDQSHLTFNWQNQSKSQQHLSLLVPCSHRLRQQLPIYQLSCCWKFPVLQ